MRQTPNQSPSLAGRYTCVSIPHSPALSAFTPTAMRAHQQHTAVVAPISSGRRVIVHKLTPIAGQLPAQFAAWPQRRPHRRNSGHTDFRNARFLPSAPAIRTHPAARRAKLAHAATCLTTPPHELLSTESTVTHHSPRMYHCVIFGGAQQHTAIASSFNRRIESVELRGVARHQHQAARPANRLNRAQQCRLR